MGGDCRDREKEGWCVCVKCILLWVEGGECVFFSIYFWFFLFFVLQHFVN